jgi:hypothetical protein
MNSLLELEAYGRVVGYLSDRISLRDFREWFDSATWEQTAGSDLLGQIELSLAELSSAHRTEEEFKEILHSYIPHLTLRLSPFSPTRATVETSTNNAIRMLRDPLAPSLASPVGLLREMEPA